MYHNTNESLLECTHSMLFDPIAIPGDIVWCATCADYREVVVNARSWQVACSQCTINRVYGTDQSGALRFASRHHRKLNHVIVVTRGRDLYRMYGGVPTTVVADTP